MGNEFCRGHGPVPNPNLVDHTVESTVPPIAFADVAELTTHRCRTMHGCGTDQATIKVQESGATAMHRGHVGPPVQRKSLVGCQTIAHASPIYRQIRPSTVSLGESEKNIVHARTVAEVKDSAPTLEAARINPTLDGEVRITKQGIIAHVNVVHVPFEGEAQGIARLVIEAGSIANILLIPHRQVAAGGLVIRVGHSNTESDRARSRSHVVGRSDGYVAVGIASAARGDGHLGQGDGVRGGRNRLNRQVLERGVLVVHLNGINKSNRVLGAHQVILPNTIDNRCRTDAIDGHPEGMGPADRSVIDCNIDASATKSVGRRLKVDVVVRIDPVTTSLINIDGPQTWVALRGADSRIASIRIRHVDLIDEGVADVPVHVDRRAPVAHGAIMRGIIGVVPQD